MSTMNIMGIITTIIMWLPTMDRCAKSYGLPLF